VVVIAGLMQNLDAQGKVFSCDSQTRHLIQALQIKEDMNTKVASHNLLRSNSGETSSKCLPGPQVRKEFNWAKDAECYLTRPSPS
jgi:hypothetical protein